jgi:hypothetical protein
MPSSLRALGPYLIYLVARALLWPSLTRFEIGPDQISYINIASLWATGQTQEAVNGFWSPLTSWLMIPFIWMGATPWMAGKLSMVMVGLFALWSALRLLQQFAVEWRLLIEILCALIVAVLAVRTSADLLGAGLVMLYLSQVWRPDWSGLPRAGWWAGALGGLMYLSKNYLLFFFAAHFTVTMLIHAYLNGRRRWPALARHWATGAPPLR